MKIRERGQARRAVRARRFFQILQALKTCLWIKQRNATTSIHPDETLHNFDWQPKVSRSSRIEQQSSVRHRYWMRRARL